MFTILIVDDSPLFRKSLRDTLQGRFPHVAIEEASDGVEGLKKVDTCKPQMIFMDIHLPGENGLKLTRRIKNDYSSTCIAVVTINNLPEYQKAALECGADHFACKCSWNRDDIFTLVESVLSRQGYNLLGIATDNRVHLTGAAFNQELNDNVF